MSIPIIKHASYYIPIAELDKSAIDDAKERFTFRFYEEKMCKPCPHLRDRFNEDSCGSCSAYKGGVQLAKVERVGSGRYLALPRASPARIKQWAEANDLDKFKVIDKTAERITVSKPYRFTGKLIDYQEKALANLPTDSGRGMLVSPPRSGKTVMGAAFAARTQLKTLILGHQAEWLVNFQETFVGSATQKAMTTASPDRVRFCKTLADFMSADIALATFQQFWSEGGLHILKQIASQFSLVLIDEVQFAASPESRAVIRQLNPLLMFGLSGTLDRKDKLHVLSRHLIGPTLHTVEMERLVPTVQLLETNIDFSIRSRHRVAFLNTNKKMHKHPKRTDLIVKAVIRLAKEGHFVLVPMTFVDEVERFCRLINEDEADNTSIYESDFARVFHGKLKKDVRRRTIKEAREGKFKILVANTALISVGVNIPRASALVDRVGMSSNVPKALQRISRILTPMDGKPNPVLLCIVDKGDAVRAMFSNEWFNAIAQLNPIVSPAIKERIKAIVSGRASKEEIDMKDI